MDHFTREINSHPFRFRAVFSIKYDSKTNILTAPVLAKYTHGCFTTIFEIRFVEYDRPVLWLSVKNKYLNRGRYKENCIT